MTSQVYTTSHFENGLTLATAEMPHMRSVSVGVWVGVGSRFEPAPLNGVCHFIEHLVFKGTQTRTARDISEAVEGIGGYLNAYTSEEITCFHAKACHEHFSDLLDVLMDMLLNARLTPSDIRKEREVIKEEISMYLDEPQHHVQELLNATLWPHHPLGRSITGTPRSLNSMQRPVISQFLRRNYVGRTTVVVAAGCISHKEARKALLPYVKRLPAGDMPDFATAPEQQLQLRAKLKQKDTEQAQLAVGVRTCSRHDSRRFALRVLNTILGENMSSRLFQVLREDRGLAYSIYSSPSFFADTGDLVVSAGLEAGNVRQALRLISREMRRLRDDLLTRKEMERAREYLLGQIDLNLESTDNQMNWVGEQWLGYGKVFSPEEAKKRILQVSAAEVRGCAREFFQASRVNLAMVSPLRPEASLLIDIARQFSSLNGA